jgi:heme exporter protein D
MNWGSLENFLAMGGYGFFVWSAYGVTALAVVLELWSLRRRKLRAQAAVERRD